MSKCGTFVFQNFEDMKYLIVIVLAIFTLSCNSTSKIGTNPPANGFDQSNSDAKAIAMADEVIAWDETRYFAWNFFGARNLLWDKKTGDVRIEIPKDDMTILVNVMKNTGRVQKGNEEYTHRDSLDKFLERGKNIWINDSYWLVMPFKLKDSGVTLKYVKEGKTQADEAADILSLTFKGVGKTPDNKYWVYVDKANKLITQWDFYTKASDAEARFSTPWGEYKKHGNLLLSGDRGQRDLTNIAVLNDVPSNYFSSLEKIDWEQLKN